MQEKHGKPAFFLVQNKIADCDMLLVQLIQRKPFSFGKHLSFPKKCCERAIYFSRKDLKLPMMHCSKKRLSAESSDTGTT